MMGLINDIESNFRVECIAKEGRKLKDEMK
jgi:hypothetical protein